MTLYDIFPQGRNSGKFDDELNVKFLSVFTKEFGKSMCFKSQKIMGYKGKIFEEIEEPNFFVFTYKNGLKKEHFAVRCSENNDLFFHFLNPNQGAMRVNFVFVKAKLMQQTMIGQQPEYSLSWIIV